ncbi:venom allergen 5-like [Cylas formicarius]|uniref:venom allergen 5-like n=1 Tax=Cylas formicarius TaxID=197179 RepID=UPI002958B12A|nr:venom allergen 5-like isoform X2 [Cylas formicarius]XP_060527446.1 venom allergen 5-like [Cylas formicarius]XP_060527447.1 venom allergen 5-like [Cylas formicarius]
MACFNKIVLVLGGLAFSNACNIFVSEVSEGEKSFIVDKHNELRRLIANDAVEGQPRGVNLKALKYDDALAGAAQQIANSCVFAHQTVTDSRWQAVGQNLYIYMSTAYDTASDWDSAIQDWFNEHQFYTFNNGFDSATGHYTQLVWADTEYVGCGYAAYETDDAYRYQKLYVCNYGPAGNYIGQYPYQTGDSGCEDLC